MKQEFCVCKKPDDGSLYVFCQTCASWLHPKCVFYADDLALTLSRQQWNKCNLACENQRSFSVDNEKQILYHVVKPKSNTQSNEKENNDQKKETIHPSDSNELNDLSRSAAQENNNPCNFICKAKDFIKNENDLTKTVSRGDDRDKSNTVRNDEGKKKNENHVISTAECSTIKLLHGVCVACVVLPHT